LEVFNILKMNRTIILGLTVLFLFNFLMAGSFAATDTDQVHIKNVEVDKEFNISLQSNPSTGYSWEADYDSEYLELVKHQFIAASEGPIAGNPGTEIFTFKALQAGQTMITFNYQFLNDEPVQTERYIIQINPQHDDTPEHSINPAAIPMQNTGTPVTAAILGLLGIIGGTIYSKLK
jgi:inhibitor of cysteine peptidase